MLSASPKIMSFRPPCGFYLVVEVSDLLQGFLPMFDELLYFILCSTTYLVKIKVNAVSYHRSNTTTYHYKKFYFQDSGKNLQVLFLTSIQVCCRIGESVCVCVCCTLIFRGSTFLHEENASEERCNQIRPSQFCWQWLVRLKIEGSFTVVITFKSHTRRRRRTCAYCEFVCFWRQIEQIDPDNTWGENFHQRHSSSGSRAHTFQNFALMNALVYVNIELREFIFVFKN